MDYEICDEPFDPRCIRASSRYRPGKEPEEAKRLLERIRGKEEDMIYNYSRQEEFLIINEQIKKSQGFDVDFTMFRCLFNFYPALLDESNPAKEPETNSDYFGRLAKEAINDYNKTEGTSFEFVKVEKANVYTNSGYVYFITFVVKDPCDQNQTKVFQAKVRNVYCREIEHSFCRPKPDQQVKCDGDSEELVKKRRYQATNLVLNRFK